MHRTSNAIKKEQVQFEKFRERGRYRNNRKSSNLSIASTTTTELEGTSAMSTNVMPSRRSVSLSKYNNSSKMTPSLAAAMLSLPYPPPQKKINQIQSGGPAPGEEEDSDTGDEKPLKEKIEATRSKSKPANMRKFYRKRRSKPSSTVAAADSANNNPGEEYKPLTIPKFQEVHTNWPGFEHEPIPNWKEKYLIARPYPKTLDELPKEMLSKPFYVSNPHLNSNSDDDVDANANNANGEEGGKEVKSRTKSKSETGQGKSSSKPKKRLQVEKIGSGCMK